MKTNAYGMKVFTVDMNKVGDWIAGLVLVLALGSLMAIAASLVKMAFYSGSVV